MDTLRTHKVMVDVQERSTVITEQAEAIAAQYSARLVLSAALLQEVSYLVEWPVVIGGSFDQDFLHVPQEALISAMASNQKYFHMLDMRGKLLPYFITVSNIVSQDEDQVRRGNERVLRPRLADARFFYHNDQQHSLAYWRQQLKQLVFMQGLGSLYDKTRRMEQLVLVIAEQIQQQKFQDREPLVVVHAQRAAELAKSDLLTTMVQEFPELQGVMGGCYARIQGEPEAVARAIQEHYAPRFADDRLPTSLEGMVLAIADRLDNLAGLFILNKIPTGDKDPFALRRAAIGVLRMILARKLDFDLAGLLGAAVKAYQQHPAVQDDLKKTVAKESARNSPDDVLQALLDFFYQRFRSYYKEQEGQDDKSCLDAVSPELISNPLDLHRRIEALQDFMQQPQASAMMAAVKRVRNMLSGQKANSVGATGQTGFKLELVRHKAEAALYQHVQELAPEVRTLLAVAQPDYHQLLHKMFGITPYIEDLFAQVMILDQDQMVRNNRFVLLHAVDQLFNYMADFSRLARV